MGKKIPKPSVERLNKIHRLLEELEGKESITSSFIGKKLGVGAHNIRKDISFLGEVGNTAAGYDVLKLKEHISLGLKLNREMKICIVGLGRLGSALLNYEKFGPGGFKIAAGFDRNINTLELLSTNVPLFPAYEIPEVIRAKKIDLAMIAVPFSGAQEAADRLVEGGIKGIINFAPVVLKSRKKEVFITNIDLLGELRLLTAFLGLEEK